MRLNRMLTITALCAFMALAGCAKKGGNAAQAGAGSASGSVADGMSQGAQSYGIGAGQEISSSNLYGDSAFAIHKNNMRAPEDQTYYFAYDNSKVRPQDVPYIKMQANYLMSHPNAKIRLEGNTDARGSREYNIALGWRRDQAVANLMQLAGVNPQQIDMVSYGKEKPAVSGDGEQIWRLNRRVNLVYEEK